MIRMVKFKSTVLLSTLLALILLYPLFQNDLWGSRLLSAATFFVIIGGLWELHNDRRWFVPAIVLAIPSSAATVLEISVVHLPRLVHLLQIPFYALLAANLVVYTLKPGRITTDKLAAAVSGYLMLGFTWASIYRFIEAINPGSFVSAFDETLSSFDYLYFSFVTLTTLGYGDISAITDRARSFVILEAIIGTLYMVILISRLVSTFGSEGRTLLHPEPASSPIEKAPPKSTNA